VSASGAVYDGVPTVRVCVPNGTIAPKSISLALPSAARRMLRGVTSRCTSLRECSSDSAEHTSHSTAQTSFHGRRGCAERSPPSSSSMV
jgi:hypothetical protein